MNKTLLAEFTVAEVHLAIHQMAPLKTHRLDGMPPFFYQKYWHIIGNEVIRAILVCLVSSQILKNINHIFITLIPKVKCPTKVSEF